MICGFKQKFSDGTPTYFREKILASARKVSALDIVSAHASGQCQYSEKGVPIGFAPKLHTLRIGNRWGAGMSIQMAYGVRTKNYEQFNKGITELEIVKSVQTIKIEGRPKIWQGESYVQRIWIDGKSLCLTHSQIVTLAINDGFVDGGYGEAAIRFFNWFSKDFEGQIIHWTDLRY